MRYDVYGCAKRFFIHSPLSLLFGVSSLGPTLPALAAQMNAETKQIGNLFIARSFGTLIGLWMIGRFYDRISGHPLLASSLLAAAAALALVPSAPQLPILLALTAFLGFALASINVGGNALIVMVHRERVTRSSARSIALSGWADLWRRRWSRNSTAGPTGFVSHILAAGAGHCPRGANHVSFAEPFIA